MLAHTYAYSRNDILHFLVGKHLDETGTFNVQGFRIGAVGWPGSGDLTYNVNPNIEGPDVNCFSILDLRRVCINI